MVYVWSNGPACGHCCGSITTMVNKTFRDFVKSYKIVWCYVSNHGSDADSKDSWGNPPYDFAEGQAAKSGGVTYRSKAVSDPVGYPCTCFYWRKKLDSGKYKVLIDKIRAPYALWENSGDGQYSSRAKKAVSEIKKEFSAKMKTYKYDPATGQYKS